MKNHAKAFVNSAMCLTASLIFCHALAAPARAQTLDKAVNKNIENDLLSREWNLTHIPDQVNGQFKQEQVSTYRQVQEDFTNIQVVNNKMLKTVFLDKALDYKLISTTAEEIRKRALRLKANLMLPKVAGKEKEQGEQAPSDDEQLKAALLTLDRSIMSFVTNPVFKMSNVIDPTLAAKAGRDLDSIIEFSVAIRKNVRNLDKTASHAH